jgi:hypothetical protein
MIEEFQFKDLQIITGTRIIPQKKDIMLEVVKQDGDKFKMISRNFSNRTEDEIVFIKKVFTFPFKHNFSRNRKIISSIGDSMYEISCSKDRILVHTLRETGIKHILTESTKIH